MLDSREPHLENAKPLRPLVFFKKTHNIIDMEF